MTTPRFFLGATLLLWGVQTGQVAAAIAIAAAIEGRTLVRGEWNLEESDAYRLGELCVVLVLGSIVYMYAVRAPIHAVMGVIEWLPATLLPLLLAQIYGAADTIPIVAVFRWLRRAADESLRVDLAPAYFASTIFAAGAANASGWTFYVGSVALLGWALVWRARPRTSPVVWGSLFACAAVMGFGIHVGMAGAQRILEQKITDLVYRLRFGDVDPTVNRTAIGEIGELKLSDRIELRVRSLDDRRPVGLLRKATFDSYFGTSWLSRRATFRPVDVRGGSWVVGPEPERSRDVSISMTFPNGRGVLPVPAGTFRIEGLIAEGEQTTLDALRVRGAPGLATWRASYGRSREADARATEMDLRLPDSERALFVGLARDLELDPARPAEVLDRVAKFFAPFRYSTWQSGTSLGSTPLETFLLETRRGHCEFFATASVLLLRAGGVPARYVSGYAVLEYSRLEAAWIVRQRHGHSWAIAEVDGSWVDFDTTPSVWAEVEANHRAIWQPLADFFSWLSHQFSLWRWSEDRGGTETTLLWILAALVAFLSVRVYQRLRGGEVVDETKPVDQRPEPIGLDSELLDIEAALREAGAGRHPHETSQQWIDRVSDEVGDEEATRELQSIVALHYRYRFDPTGLDAPERRQLASQARAWLDRYRTRRDHAA